ncbi:MAG: ester cyclase [Firmicutes bacterium]|nr:ester cyclase [Bacillota bacterium]
MEQIEMAHRYFKAWNQHDPAGIAAALVEGGTYEDPSTGRPLQGEEIAAYADSLFTAFPDLAFQLTAESAFGPETMAAQWSMTGTNRGPFLGMPPTGKTVRLHGADFITFEHRGIRSVRGYFDRRTFAEQLGWQVVVQPEAAGPFQFGIATRVSADRTEAPGAFSLTWIEVDSAARREEVRGLTRQIAAELRHTPGFLGWIGGMVGYRLFTVTAWQTAEDARRLLTEGTHREAMRRFFEPEFGANGWTGVWVPHHLNATWARCPSCGSLVDYGEQGEKCQCGATLQPPHPW